MKKDQIARMEKRLAAAFMTAEVPGVTPHWQEEIMGNVRRLAARTVEVSAEPINTAFRMMWKMTAASVATASLCVAIYLFAPSPVSNSSSTWQTTGSSYDCFDTVVTAVAKL